MLTNGIENTVMSQLYFTESDVIFSLNSDDSWDSSWEQSPLSNKYFALCFRSNTILVLIRQFSSLKNTFLMSKKTQRYEKSQYDWSILNGEINNENYPYY